MSREGLILCKNSAHTHLCGATQAVLKEFETPSVVSLHVILLLEVRSLAAALQHLMQQLFGHMRALLPAGLLLQRSAQRVVRRLGRGLAPACADGQVCSIPHSRRP